MTYEEAKMQIQAIPEKIWDQLSEPDREAMEMAFSALEKQIPMKPKKSKEPRCKIICGGKFEYYDWVCPICGEFLAFETTIKSDHHHCVCGQAIDWEECER